jgi:hypothetical protein
VNVARGKAGRHELVGAICSAGFASGDRFVVGYWDSSPIGPMVDVMWARPDGERVLLAESRTAADFISAVYRFDRVEVTDVSSRFDGRSLSLTTSGLELAMQGGRGWRLPLRRARLPWFTRWVEGPLARLLLGVRTFGVSPTGVMEWYRAEAYRPVVTARAMVGGCDLGGWVPFHHPVHFGFSEPPRRPSIVLVRPLLVDPSGRLDHVLADAAGRAASAGPWRPTP